MTNFNEVTDEKPRELAEVALEKFRNGKTVTIQYPMGNSFRSDGLSDYGAPYEIEDADNGVRIVPDRGVATPVREGCVLTHQ